MKGPVSSLIITNPSGRAVEYDTVTCCHCSAAIVVKPGSVNTVYLVPDLLNPLGPLKEVPGAACYNCGLRPVCLKCEEKGTCRPLELMLDEIEGTRRHGTLLIGAPTRRLT